MRLTHRPKFRGQSHGFTLIELLVAIFLLLIVMVGVNTVFTTTGQAAGTNQAISELARTARAVQTTMGKDFSSCAADGAAFIIRNEQIYQFRNAAEKAADIDGNPYTIPDPSTGADAMPTQAFRACLYNGYSHRRDRVSFFTRQLARRQTGNDNVLIANESGLEQWVWYGHLRLPDNTANPAPANFFDPGDRDNNGVQFASPGANPNNFFANQWVVGRQGMLLVTPDSTGNVYDASLVPQNGIFNNPQALSAGPITSDAGTDYYLSPLSVNAHNGTKAWFMDQSRYDLAGTSIQGFSTLLASVLANTPTYNFWQEMMSGRANIAAGGNRKAGYIGGSRFQAIPFIGRPISAEYAARTTPILAPAVSQFIVEFAGDFVSQEDDGSTNDGRVGYSADGSSQPGCYFTAGTGALNPSGQDGKIDFYVSNPGKATAVRAIRWYGMPRSQSGNTSVSIANGDVCPLRDTIQSAAGYAGVASPIERTDDSTSQDTNTVNILTGTPPWGTSGTNMGAPTAAGLQKPYFYIAAWGSKDTVRPKLVRIVMTLEDSNNRLADGQTFEYVFPLQ